MKIPKIDIPPYPVKDQSYHSIVKAWVDALHNWADEINKLVDEYEC